MDLEETRAFFKRDTEMEMTIGEKIYVTSGELQQAHGIIINFEEGGSIVNFRPTNIEGFEDTITLDRTNVVKYFEQGDPIRVIEGKYIYETGIIIFVDESNVTQPRVKIDSTDVEVTISTSHLKMKSANDKDDIKMNN